MNESEFYSQLHKFIAENNHHGWANDEEIEAPIFPGWKRHVHESADGLWVADDNYTGSIAAPGFTVINFKERPAYMVQYGGPGLLAGYCEGPVKVQVIGNLRRALKASAPDMPWRGPARMEFENGMVYTLDILRSPRERHEVLAEERMRIGASVLTFQQFIIGSPVLGKKKDGTKDYPWEW